MNFFQNIQPIDYQFYKPKQLILGKTMEEHLRLSVCFWHTFCWQGTDMFGKSVFDRPWKTKEEKIRAGFEFIEKLGLKYYTFHDVDVADEGPLEEVVGLMAEEMEKRQIELLWGTANLTGHPRYLAGAATNPDPYVFASAVHQVKETLDATHQLNGHNYVLWGGREGYETHLNTDMAQELNQLGRFLSLLADYKHKIGFKGTLLIEPKPHEPTKHQYDFDVANVYAFLQKHGLEKEYKVNIECNHATLSGHTLPHEVAYAISHDLFGSIDANQGDPLLGWDTDQFPSDINTYTQTLYLILLNGGFQSGGFNLDAKVRRQSLDLEDLFYGHVLGIETIAKALLNAAHLIETGHFQEIVRKRYQGWESDFGKQIMSGKMSFEAISNYVKTHKINPKPVSGRQEYLELYLNRINAEHVDVALI